MIDFLVKQSTGVIKATYLNDSLMQKKFRKTWTSKKLLFVRRSPTFVLCNYRLNTSSLYVSYFFVYFVFEDFTKKTPHTAYIMTALCTVSQIKASLVRSYNTLICTFVIKASIREKRTNPFPYVWVVRMRVSSKAISHFVNQLQASR